MTFLIILLLVSLAAVWISLNNINNELEAIKHQLSRIALRMPVNQGKLDSIAASIRGELMNLEKSHPHIFSSIPENIRKHAIVTATTLLNTYRSEQLKQELAPESRLAHIEVPKYLDRLIALCAEYHDIENA